MTLGEKIKELRKKNGFTQEKLAEYLAVSYQAVSKWECGTSYPDLSMIGPLTRLLHVSADELLGLDPAMDNTRRVDLERAYQEYSCNRESKESYHLAAEAVREYPRDFRYLEWLAESEYYLAFNESLLDNGEDNGYSSDFYNEMIENSMRHYEIVIDDCTDWNIRNQSICGMILALKLAGRMDEARWYAETVYPDCPMPDKGTVVGWILTDAEKRRHQQNQIISLSEKLINQLISVRKSDDPNICDLEYLVCAEKFIKQLIPDENYLYYYDYLYIISIFKAQFYQYTNQNEAIEALRDAYKYAVKFDDIFVNSPGVYKYSAPVCDMVEINTSDYITKGTEENNKRVDNFEWWLNGKCFDSLRGHRDFEKLFKKMSG